MKFYLLLIIIELKSGKIQFYSRKFVMDDYILDNNTIKCEPSIEYLPMARICEGYKHKIHLIALCSKNKILMIDNELYPESVLIELKKDGPNLTFKKDKKFVYENTESEIANGYINLKNKYNEIVICENNISFNWDYVEKVYTNLVNKIEVERRKHNVQMCEKCVMNKSRRKEYQRSRKYRYIYLVEPNYNYMINSYKGKYLALSNVNIYCIYE